MPDYQLFVEADGEEAAREVRKIRLDTDPSKGDSLRTLDGRKLHVLEFIEHTPDRQAATGCRGVIVAA